MSVSRPGEAFDDDGDDTDDSDVPPGLEESIVEESIARGQPRLIFSSTEDAPVDAGQQSESDADCTEDDMRDAAVCCAPLSRTSSLHTLSQHKGGWQCRRYGTRLC